MMYGNRTTMPYGVQIEEVILWVETFTKNLVWKVHKGNESIWLQLE